MVVTAFGTIETAVRGDAGRAPTTSSTKPFTPDVLRAKVEKAAWSCPRERRRRWSARARAEALDADRVRARRPARWATAEPHAAAARAGAQGRRHRRHRARARRVRHRQGAGRAHAPRRSPPREDGPFVAVHCAALAETLLESELFGHERGAFTGAVKRKLGRFELADGGHALPRRDWRDPRRPCRPSCCACCRSGEFERVGGEETVKVDVRVVAATHRDLAGRGEGRALPRGPLLPAPRRAAAAPAAARAPRGHRRARASTSSRSTRRGVERRVKGLDAERAARAAGATPGRATCASSRTSSSSRSSSPRASAHATDLPAHLAAPRRRRAGAAGARRGPPPARHPRGPRAPAHRPRLREGRRGEDGDGAAARHQDVRALLQAGEVRVRQGRAPRGPVAIRAPPRRHARGRPSPRRRRRSPARAAPSGKATPPPDGVRASGARGRIHPTAARGGRARRGTWYDDGGLCIEQSFREGLRDGPFVERHRNGRIAREGTYAAGQKVGTWRIAYESGAAEEESEWLGGTQHGRFVAWWRSRRAAHGGAVLRRRAVREVAHLRRGGEPLGEVDYLEQSLRP